MKTRTSIILSAVLGSMLFSIPVSAKQHEAKAAPVDESAKGTLYIEYRENQIEFHAPRYNSINNELDRYYYFKSNFEKAFKEAGWPVNLEFARFPIKVPEGAKVLRMTFLGLRAANPIELELRLWAKLDRGEKTDDFGVRLASHAPSPILSSGSVERDLNTLYSKAAAMVVEDLNNTLFKSES